MCSNDSILTTRLPGQVCWESVCEQDLSSSPCARVGTNQGIRQPVGEPRPDLDQYLTHPVATACCSQRHASLLSGEVSILEESGSTRDVSRHLSCPLWKSRIQGWLSPPVSSGRPLKLATFYAAGAEHAGATQLDIKAAQRNGELHQGVNIRVRYWSLRYGILPKQIPSEALSSLKKPSFGILLVQMGIPEDGHYRLGRCEDWQHRQDQQGWLLFDGDDPATLPGHDCAAGGLDHPLAAGRLRNDSGIALLLCSHNGANSPGWCSVSQVLGADSRCPRKVDIRCVLRLLTTSFGFSWLATDVHCKKSQDQTKFYQGPKLPNALQDDLFKTLLRTSRARHRNRWAGSSIEVGGLLLISPLAECAQIAGLNSQNWAADELSIEATFPIKFMSSGRMDDFL